MSSALKIALIHMAVTYKDPAANRERLLALIDEAAKQGARLIVAPEMALSGYSFESRADIVPYVETIDGPTVTRIRERAETHGVYICAGLAFCDPGTGIFTNSAVAAAPNGRVVCRYDKINAESRWACPGDPRQDNTFDTPWGRVGILICSDSYHALIPRITALREVDLLLVPANWPNAGIDPLELWRARALENGVYLAGCNRSGMDRIMDCRNASSCVYDPSGELLLHGSKAESHIFTADLPLTQKGRLCRQRRRQCLGRRRPEFYHDCYLNLRMIPDLTPFYNLSEPGELDLYCVVPQENQHPTAALDAQLKKSQPEKGSLFLLPAFAYSEENLLQMAQNARRQQVGILTRAVNKGGKDRIILADKEERKEWEIYAPAPDRLFERPVFDFGPARIHLATAADIAHPEPALVAAKKGGDLLIAMEENLSPQTTMLGGIRTIEQLAVGLCGRNAAGLWRPPDGHKRWRETLAGPGRGCRMNLDTRLTRRKIFQDNVDFELLLRRP